MNKLPKNTIKPGKSDELDSIPGDPVGSADGMRKKSLSMHDGVPVWYDCCSCEAEPYWTELAGEPESQ